MNTSAFRSPEEVEREPILSLPSPCHAIQQNLGERTLATFLDEKINSLRIRFLVSSGIRKSGGT